jgi:hypothetical protein
VEEEPERAVDAGKYEAGDGPDHGDAEVGPGRQSVALELGYPAEQPEGNAPDPDPVSLGHHGVGHLMGKQGREEQDCGDDPDDPVDRRGVMGVVAG